MSDDKQVDPVDGFGLVRSFTRHIAYVRLALSTVEQAIQRRGLRHDLSKMLDDEFAGFSRINAAARINKFGSPEYTEGMQREKQTIDLHFSRNSHHAEHYLEHPCGMTFLDIIEMVCDWWGAGKGYDDPRPWRDSVALNFQQKGKFLSPEQLWLAQQVADFLEQERPHVR